MDLGKADTSKAFDIFIGSTFEQISEKWLKLSDLVNSSGCSSLSFLLHIIYIHEEGVRGMLERRAVTTTVKDFSNDIFRKGLKCCKDRSLIENNTKADNDY